MRIVIVRADWREDAMVLSAGTVKWQIQIHAAECRVMSEGEKQH